MARSVEPLVVGKVIGDVVDMFTPAADFTVHYGLKHVGNGCDIKPSVAADRPRVQITNPPRASTHLFTLVMVDPDAPSPSEPTMREWLHWIVTDIPGGAEVTKGKEVIPYLGPKPPTGIHRYIFVLFRQQEGTKLTTRPPLIRANFSTRQFAAENGLGHPVAALYYNSQKEPATRKR